MSKCSHRSNQIRSDQETSYKMAKFRIENSYLSMQWQRYHSKGSWWQNYSWPGRQRTVPKWGSQCLQNPLCQAIYSPEYHLIQLLWGNSCFGMSITHVCDPKSHEHQSRRILKFLGGRISKVITRKHFLLLPNIDWYTGSEPSSPAESESSLLCSLCQCRLLS